MGKLQVVVAALAKAGAANFTSLAGDVNKLVSGNDTHTLTWNVYLPRRTSPVDRLERTSIRLPHWD